MQPKLKTAGDLRAFLAEVLVGIRDGSIDANKANSISKVAAQINQSLATEVTTALKFKELGGENAVAGSLALFHQSEDAVEVLPHPEPTRIAQSPSELPDSIVVVDQLARKAALIASDKIWCEQCELNVTVGQAVGCKSKFCKAKEAA